MAVTLDYSFVSLIVRRASIPADCTSDWAIAPGDGLSRSVSDDLIRMSFMGGDGYDYMVRQMNAVGLAEWDADGRSLDFVEVPPTGVVPDACPWLETGYFTLLSPSTVGWTSAPSGSEQYAWLKANPPARLAVPDRSTQGAVECVAVPGRIELVRGDITGLKVDAIVNAANSTLTGGGGVDGAIHRAAGPGLKEECRGLGGCKVGEVKVTRGHRLSAQWVLHTVGPFWSQHDQDESGQLEACYRNALQEATRLGARSVAFPCISTGVYHYPSEDAAEVAVDTVRRYLCESGAALTVTFCCYARLDYDHYARLLGVDSEVCSERSGFIAAGSERAAAKEKRSRLRSVVKGSAPPEAGDWTLEPL